MAYYCAFAYVGDFYCKTRTIRLREQSQEARPSASGPGFGLVEDPIKTQYKTKQTPLPPCSLPARLGPARSGLAITAPHGHGITLAVK